MSGREKILKAIFRNHPLEEEFLQKCAERTEYFTGADLCNLYKLSACYALRRHTLSSSASSLDGIQLSLLDVEKALSKSFPSLNRLMLERYERFSSTSSLP
eukprot:Sdes_comp16027_c0_seq2m5215